VIAVGHGAASGGRRPCAGRTAEKGAPSNDNVSLTRLDHYAKREPQQLAAADGQPAACGIRAECQDAANASAGGPEIVPATKLAEARLSNDVNAA